MKNHGLYIFSQFAKLSFDRKYLVDLTAGVFFFHFLNVLIVELWP